eukprot:g4496.t1
MSHVQAYLSDGERGRWSSLERELHNAKDPYGRPWSEALTSSSLVLLGSGGFGSVSRFQVDDGSPWKRMEGYVLKQMLPRRQDQNDVSWLAQKEKCEKALRHEVDMLMWARFKGAQFVPRIVARITVDGLPAIVMEHAGEKTLLDIREAAVEVRVDAMAQVMCALIELRNLSMFHGDVKETNVVVSPRDDQGRPVENANLPNFHHYKVTLVDFGAAQICDELGMVPELRALTRGYIDLMEVVRMYCKANVAVPPGEDNVNAFWYDMFSWASMVAKMFPDTFEPDVHEILGIRLKHEAAGAPAAFEALHHVIRRATSLTIAARMGAATAANTVFYQDWLKNGLSRASASSRGVGASSSGSQATGNGGGAAGWGGGGAVGAGGGGAAGSGGGAGRGVAASMGGGGAVGAGGGGAAAGAAGSNNWQPPHNSGEAAAAGPMSGGQSGGHQQSSGSSSSSTDDDEDHGGGAGGGQGVCHGPPAPANAQTDEETETDQLQQDEETETETDQLEQDEEKETDQLQQDEAPKDDEVSSYKDISSDYSTTSLEIENTLPEDQEEEEEEEDGPPEAEQPATAQAGERVGGAGAGAAGEAIVHGGGGGSSSVVYLETRWPVRTTVAPQAQGTESSAGTGSPRGAPLMASAANLAAIKQRPSGAGGAANVSGRVAVDAGGEGGGRSGTGSQHPPVGIQGKTAAGSDDAASIPPQEVPRSRPTRSATRRGKEGVAGGAAGGEAARVPSGVKTRRMIRELELKFASEAPGVRTRSMSRAREAGGTAGAEAAQTTTGIKRRRGGASQPAATIKRPRSGAGKARQPATGAKRPPSAAGEAPETGTRVCLGQLFRSPPMPRLTARAPPQQLRMYLLLLLLLLLFPLGSVRCETSTLVACFAPPMKHDSLASCGPPRIDGGRLPLRVVGAAHTSAALT